MYLSTLDLSIKGILRNGPDLSRSAHSRVPLLLSCFRQWKPLSSHRVLSTHLSLIPFKKKKCCLFRFPCLFLKCCCFWCLKSVSSILSPGLTLNSNPTCFYLPSAGISTSVAPLFSLHFSLSELRE